MKTNKLFALSIAACCALGASALADQPNNHPGRNMKDQSRQIEQPRPSWDDQPMFIRTVGYPVVFLGRAGHSIVRSPRIVSDTVQGNRVFICKHGMFVPLEADRD